MSNNGSYSRKTVNIKEVHSNTEQQLIQITEDKLENIFLKQVKNLNIKNSWVSPASILVAVGLTKTTATFNKALGLSAAVWEALFILVGIGCSCWLIRNLFLIYKSWDKSSIPNLIASIKNSNHNS